MYVLFVLIQGVEWSSLGGLCPAVDVKTTAMKKNKLTSTDTDPGHLIDLKLLHLHFIVPFLFFVFL